MKKYIKLLLLTVFALSAFNLAFAQSRQAPSAVTRQIYQDQKVKDAIEFIKHQLPELIKTDRARAISEYERHFANLNKLNEQDVLFLVGHFYTMADDAKTAIPLFIDLIKDSRLGDDARQMLYLLIYQRSVAYLLAENPETTNYLKDVLNGLGNQFDTGKYYPLFLYLWSDIVSGTEKHQEVADYLAYYEQNRVWVQNQYNPRKAAIVNRLESLDLEPFYQNPTDPEYLKLENAINAIHQDLNTLYSEARTMRGLVLRDYLDELYAEESRILGEMKAQLKSYKDIPQVNLSALASSDPTSVGVSAYEKYREGALLIQELRFTADYYTKVIALMDAVFEKRYELFVSGDPSVIGRDFSDMEMKRLYDIERNIETYDDLINTIQTVMQTPEYKAQTAMDLRPQLREYQEKRQDLQLRKQTYLTMRKHESEAEELYFNELLEEYYALERDRLELTETLDLVEEQLISMMMMQYPDDVKEIIESQQNLVIENSPALEVMQLSVAAIQTNLDYIRLQNSYRQLSFRERQRQESARENKLSDAELEREYNDIVAAKTGLLADYRAFVSANPDFMAFEQPSGGFLVSNANTYYNMGELAFAVDLNDPTEALGFYRQALATDPDFYLKDFALYNIAYISGEFTKSVKGQKIAEFRELYPNRVRTDEFRYTPADFDEAIQAYVQIKDQYPNSAYYDESLYRLGVLYFLIGTDAERPIEWYAKANQEFDILVAKGNSRYSYEALYQRGFVKMNSGTDEDLNSALDDFAAIIKAVDAGKIDNAALASDLKSTAMDNVSYCLIALDGTDHLSQAKGLAALNRVLGDYQDENALAMILDRAAANKKDMNLTMQSIDFLENRLQRSPNLLGNPALVDSILVLYYTPGLQLRPGVVLDNVRNEKYMYSVATYAKDGAWYNQHIKDKDIQDPKLSKQLESIKRAYHEVMVSRYQAVLADYSDEAYKSYSEHVNKFAGYSELFGADFADWKKDIDRKDMILVSNLAERRKTAPDYMLAYQKRVGFNATYPETEQDDILRNEGLAYQYADAMYDMSAAQIAAGTYQEQAGMPADKAALQAFYTEAVERYYRVLTGPFANAQGSFQTANRIYLKLAGIEFASDMKSKAKERYQYMLQNEEILDVPSKYAIYLNLAYIAEEEEDYVLAETHFRKALTLAKAEDRELIDSLIKLQIQNSYEKAEASGDFVAAAANYAKLAEEFKADAQKYSEYKGAEANAYIKAKNYNAAIETYMLLAGMKTNIDEVFTLYYLSWSTADTLMMDPIKGQQIRNEFMDKYPTSSQTYSLRVEAIQKKAAVPSEREIAAQEYIALAADVKANRINSGGIPSEAIYLEAFKIHDDDKQTAKKLQVLSDFVTTYPNYQDNNIFIKALALGYYELGDTLRFDDYAKQLFRRDKTQSDLYLAVAERELNKILIQFDTAYLNKQWTQAFAKRDEYQRMEAAYKKEGLVMDHTRVYDNFTLVQQEYDRLQKKLAFLRSYDAVLAGVENGNFFKQTPNQHLTVGVKTTWKNHFMGPKTQLLANFRTMVNVEYNKVNRQLTAENLVMLDPARIVKALTLMARIKDYGIQVITTQINKYFDVANEIQPFKTSPEFPSIKDGIWGVVNNDFIYPLEDESSALYMSAYLDFHLAGYVDANTERAIAKLAERKQLSEYQKDEYVLGSAWTMRWKQENDQFSPVNTPPLSTTSPRGQKLGTMNVLAQRTLQADLNFNAKVMPDFAYVQMVYPYDPEIYVNEVKMPLALVAIDTLEVNKPITTRYAIRLTGDKWQPGNNVVKVLFPNKYQEAVPLHFALQVYYNKEALRDALPKETTRYGTNEQWQAGYILPEAGAVASKAIISNSFNIERTAIEGLSGQSAQPIWLTESVETPYYVAYFEREFNVAGDFLEGSLEYVVPEYATVYLNDTLLVEGEPVDMEMDPIMVFPRLLDIPAQSIKQGANKLRIVVNNQSQFRGILAELTIIQAGKE